MPDSLGIEWFASWGHSAGGRHPALVSAVVVEALHVDRARPRSREFFRMMAEDPDGFGPKVGARLAADHGDDYWRAVLGAGGRAWLDIARAPDEAFFDGRLGEITAPVLVVHGADDPRTEPGEL